MDAEEFRRSAKQLVDYAADYIENIRCRSVLPSVQPGYIRALVNDQAPEEGERWEDVFKDIERVIMPGMTHWNSPHFHAYFPTANSYPAMCADIVSSALTCVGFSWMASPACTELETVVLDWLGKMLKLPSEFLFCSGGPGGGVIQGTASESTLMALLAARGKTLASMRRVNPQVNFGLLDKLVAYSSDQGHSSVERAGMLGAVRMRLLPADNNYSLRGETLAAAIKEDKAKGDIPFFVVVTLGTTSTCAFDNLEEIGRVCDQEKVWLHVDAAYAGAAFTCPEFRPLLNGVEYANSVNFNPHKWMLVNFDCSTMWVKDRHDLTEAFMVNPVYLRHDKEGMVPDYRHWQIPLGRRFRSLKIWFVLRIYGVSGIQAHIRKQVALAQEFLQLVKKDDRFEVVTPVILGLVCFRLKGANELSQRLVDEVNSRKRIHLTPTLVRGKYIIRFAVCSRSTESEDITFAWNEICLAAKHALKTCSK